MIVSGFQFRSWFAFVVVIDRATLLRADPADPGGMAAIAASKKVGYIDSRVAITVYQWACKI